MVKLVLKCIFAKGEVLGKRDLSPNVGLNQQKRGGKRDQVRDFKN